MKTETIIDITQELFSCRVFPGDASPKKEELQRIAEGGSCNLTAFSMCAHNGTHVDAPFHFIENGKTIDEMGLIPYVGRCYVARHDGDVTGPDAQDILARAHEADADQRILIAGNATVTADAARAFAEAGILLYGNESQTVGPIAAPAEVHRILLGANVTLLEGIVLTAVEEGVYFLSAAPLNLGGCDGAPCRAFLISL